MSGSCSSPHQVSFVDLTGTLFCYKVGDIIETSIDCDVRIMIMRALLFQTIVVLIPFPFRTITKSPRTTAIGSNR